MIQVGYSDLDKEDNFSDENITNIYLKIKISKEEPEVKARKVALCQLFIKLKKTNITPVNSTINQ